MAADSKRLQDVLLRHQVYLEGVKVAYSVTFSRVVQLLIVELRKLFSRLNVDTLDALTKAQLAAFIVQVRELQRRHYNKFIVELLRNLEEFMRVDLDVSKILFAAMIRGESSAIDGEKVLLPEFENIVEAEGSKKDGLFAFAFLDGTKTGNDKLWRAISNGYLPASGHTLLPFLSAFVAAASAGVIIATQRAYANRMTPAAAMASIAGTSERNFRDGSLNRVNAQGSAVIETAIQHIDAMVQTAVASLFYSKYQWLSVIDGATTAICRGRNRKIYEYGKGPLPPAHIHCRSKTAPYVGSNSDGPLTFGAWIKTQPSKVRKDIGEGDTFKASSLSLKQFRAKLSLMLLEDDDEA